MKVNINKLRNICTLSEVNLNKYILNQDKQFEDYGNFLYKKTKKAKILSVAHMDVAWGVDQSMFRTYEPENDVHVFSPALDDRLGVFTILNILPQYGIKTDVLFTTDEECCQSTASDFLHFCEKDYNWIVEFDRAGTDVVMYDYREDEELPEDLVSAGFKLGTGTYSDIADLETLGVGAFNMGIGYHFQHTPQCMAYMTELMRQMERLREFYMKFEDKRYEHIIKTWTKSHYSWKQYGYEDWYGDDFDRESMEAKEISEGNNDPFYWNEYPESQDVYEAYQAQLGKLKPEPKGAYKSRLFESL